MKNYTLTLILSLTLLLAASCGHEPRTPPLEANSTLWIQWENGKYKEKSLYTYQQHISRDQLREHGDSGTLKAVMDYSICYHNKYDGADIDDKGSLWCSIDFATSASKPISLYNPQASPIDTLGDNFFMVPWFHQLENSPDNKIVSFEIRLCAIGQKKWEGNSQDTNSLPSSTVPESLISYSQGEQYLLQIIDEIPDLGDTLTLQGRRSYSEAWISANEHRLGGITSKNWMNKLVFEVHGSNIDSSPSHLHRLQHIVEDQMEKLWDRFHFAQENIDDSHVIEPLPNPYTEGPYRDGFVVLRMERK